jgi:hypothetical protein
MEKANKKKQENLDTTTKVQLNNEKYKEFLSEDVVKPLLNFGYDLDQVMMAFKIYNFTTVDDAIHILMKDPETGKFHHRFINNTERNNEGYEGVKGSLPCMICGEEMILHIDYDTGNQNSKDIRLDLGMQKRHEEEQKDITAQIDKTNQNLKTSLNISIVNDTKINSERKNQLKIKLVEIPKETIEMFEDPDVCKICFGEVVKESNKAQFACGHSFCKTCVTNHLTVNINNGKVSNVY